jgi:hypothetical protein
MSFYNGPTIVTNGLVLSLDAADRNSYVSGSTTWRDLSGRGFNGTLINSPTFNSGNGGGIVFAGRSSAGGGGLSGNDSYVTMSLDTTLFTSEASISFFLKSRIATPTNAQNAGLSGFNNTTSGTHYPWVDGIGYFSLLRAQVGGSDNRVQGVTLSASVNRTTPHMLTVTTTPGTNGYKIYQNTINIHQVTGLNTWATNGIRIIGTVDPNSGQPKGMIGLNPESNTYLDGTVYTTLLYNRALSETEVLQNYNALKSRFGL